MTAAKQLRRPEIDASAKAKGRIVKPKDDRLIVCAWCDQRNPPVVRFRATGKPVPLETVRKMGISTDPEDVTHSMCDPCKGNFGREIKKHRAISDRVDAEMAQPKTEGRMK
jgi:hypothetical protein